MTPRFALYDNDNNSDIVILALRSKERYTVLKTSSSKYKVFRSCRTLNYTYITETVMSEYVSEGFGPLWTNRFLKIIHVFHKKYNILPD